MRNLKMEKAYEPGIWEATSLDGKKVKGRLVYDGLFDKYIEVNYGFGKTVTKIQNGTEKRIQQ